MIINMSDNVLKEFEKLLRDANRYRKLRRIVGGKSLGTRNGFHLDMLYPIDGANIMKGSVTQHFDEAVDNLFLGGD